MKRTRTLLLLLASFLLVADGARALDRDAALGAGGELYQLRSGAYKDLFPQGTAARPDSLVLALDITRPDAEPQRLLVPETEGAEAETLPALVYEDETSSVFLLWASKINAIHTIFKLASYNGRFSDPIDVAGNPYAVKNSPQLAITHDSYEDPTATGQTLTRRRTILHLEWEEEKDGNSFGTYYTPIVLEDGVYLGWNPVYALNDYFDVGTQLAAVATPVPVGLMRSPAIQAGRDGSTVVLAFPSPRGGRLITVEVDSLPRELVRLADTTRATIIDTGVRLNYPAANMRDLANQVKATIVTRGTAFHPEVVATLADRVYTQILSTGGSSQSLTRLADATRATIIDTGYKLSARGLRPTNQDLPSRTFEFSRVAGPAGAPVGLSNVIQFRMASTRPAPAGVEGPARLFVSDTGDDVVVSWAGEGRILYRDSTDTGWSDIRELRLSANLDEQHAYEILAQRAHGR